MIKNEWQYIYQKCQEQEQYLRENWFNSWAHYIKEDNDWQGKLCCDLVKGGNDTYAIIPYAFISVGPFRFASLAGDYFPRRAIPNTGANPDLIKNTVQKLTEIQGIDGFRFGPVVLEDEFIDGLYHALLKNNWKIILKNNAYEFGFELKSNKEDFLASLNGKLKSGIRRRWKQLERLGNVEMKHYNNVSTDQWAKIFSEIELIENDAWIGDTGNAKFIGKAKQRFWNSLVKDEWYRQAMNARIIYLDEKPVSYSLEIDTDDTRYGLSSSYTKDISKYGTGVIIRMEVMLQAIEAGKKFINDGSGNSGYKSAWGSEKISTLVEIVAFPPTIKGRIAYYLGLLKEKVGK